MRASHAAGTKANASFTGDRVAYGDGIGQNMLGLLNDPQTSGGLLIAVPADRVSDLQENLRRRGALAAALIGDVVARSPGEPYLEFHPLNSR